MSTPISSLVRQTKPIKEKLNIISFCFDEKHELLLANTGHNILAITVPSFLYKWNADIMTKPSNYTLLTFEHNSDLISNLPNGIEIDAIVGYERPSHYEIGKKLSQMLQIPMIIINNQFPVAVSDAFNVSSYSNMNGKLNVFGSESLKTFWNMSGKSEVVRPGVNTNKFKPELPFDKRNDKTLTVAQTFMQRNEETNFLDWKKILEGTNAALIGHNPGLPSVFSPFSSLQKHYQEARVYLNTSTGGVFPIEVIEAMASGCVVVTYDYIGMRELIKHEETGFLCKTPEEARKYIKQINSNPKLFDKVSEAARQFVLENCDLSKQSASLKQAINRVVIENKEMVYES